MAAIQGAGIGLRREFLLDVAQSPLRPDWLEVTPENWLEMPVYYRSAFEKVAQDFPLAAHGVSLSIGSPDRPDRRHLVRLKAFLDRYAITLYSEHLSFSSLKGKQSYELLPLPMTPAMLRHLVDRIDEVQSFLKRPLVLENATWYANPGASMPEASFINEVLKVSGAKLLLDINNLYVNAFNHGFEPGDFIDALDLSPIAYYHVAGHLEFRRDLWIDTHSQPAKEAVWQLLLSAYSKAPAPVLIERDGDVPDTLEGLSDEYARAQQVIALAPHGPCRPSKPGRAQPLARAHTEDLQGAFKAMERLFEVAQGRRSEPRFAIYGHLVACRHEELLSSVFRRLKALIEPDEWHKWVGRFIAHGARSPLLWRSAGEFRRFLKKEQRGNKRRWIGDLLWLEWHTLALLTRRARLSARPHDWRTPVVLSPAARVRWLKAPVFDPQWHPDDGARPCGYLLFLDPDTLQVEGLVLTRFMTDLLTHLKKRRTLKAAIKHCSRQHGLKPKAVREVIAPALKIFVQKGVLLAD